MPIYWKHLVLQIACVMVALGNTAAAQTKSDNQERAEQLLKVWLAVGEVGYRQHGPREVAELRQVEAYRDSVRKSRKSITEKKLALAELDEQQAVLRRELCQHLKFNPQPQGITPDDLDQKGFGILLGARGAPHPINPILKREDLGGWIVSVRWRGDNPTLLLRGTAPMTSGSDYVIGSPVLVTGITETSNSAYPTLHVVSDELRELLRPEIERLVDRAEYVRDWESDDGKFSTHARLVTFSNDDVTLAKDDGKQVVVPLDQISIDDLKFLRDLEAGKLTQPSGSL